MVSNSVSKYLSNRVTAASLFEPWSSHGHSHGEGKTLERRMSKHYHSTKWLFGLLQMSRARALRGMRVRIPRYTSNRKAS